MKEFAPKMAEVRQPDWVTELMKDYFAKPDVLIGRTRQGPKS